MDGGSRPNLASLENVRRVGRLLYQVQTIPRDVTLLWNDEAVHVIRKRFFENNHLAEKPRTATTLRAYVTALRLFYDFVQAKQRTRTGTPIAKEDIEKVKSCNVSLDGWLKTLAPALHVRKASIRKKDEEERLSVSDLKKLVNSPQSKEVTKKMLQLEKKKVNTVTRGEFAKYRDNLMLRML